MSEEDRRLSQEQQQNYEEEQHGEEQEEETYISNEDIEDDIHVTGPEGDVSMDEEEEEGEGDMMMDEEEQEEVELNDDSVQGFFEHKQPVYSVAFHPTNPALVASGGGDDHAYIWNCLDGEKVHDLKAHTDSITCVAFNVNGQYVASGGMDGFVRVSRTDTGECIQELEPSGEIIWIHWHPKGNVLLAGTNEGTIWMWTIPTGTVMQVISGHSESITDGRFTHDGKRIVTVSEDCSLGVWDPRTGGSVCRVSGQEDGRFHPEPITCVALSKDDTLALTGSTDGSARLIRTETGAIIQSFEAHTESVESVGFCDVLPLAALGSVDGSISIWDINTMKIRKTVRHEDAVIQVQWLPNSPLFLSCSADRTIRLWDARNGECLRTWVGHQDSVLAMDAYTETIGTEGHAQVYVVTGSDDGCALVFRR